jgi:hypothetical protein
VKRNRLRARLAGPPLSGALAVLLFLLGAVVVGDRPDFAASAAEVASHLSADRARVQAGCALLVVAMPLLVAFLATVASLAADHGSASRRAGQLAFGCGLVFVALFLVDVTALAVAALRPERLADAPETARVLLDVEFLLMGAAAPVAAAMLLALAALPSGPGGVWPAWISRAAVVAAIVYLQRTGSLFATEGAFAADGQLGLLLPVAALAGWVLLASISLALRAARSASGAGPARS